MTNLQDNKTTEYNNVLKQTVANPKQHQIQDNKTTKYNHVIVLPVANSKPTLIWV